MQVNTLEKLSGVSGHTIRYYTRCGLLKPAKGENGYHRYSDNDLIRLRIVRCLRLLYFPLDSIKQMLSLAEDGGIPMNVFYEQLQQEYQREQHEVEEKLEVIQRLHRIMENWNKLNDKQGISLQDLQVLLADLAAD
jgi:DNA-binding transcriptional MerR regulator